MSCGGKCMAAVLLTVLAGCAPRNLTVGRNSCASAPTQIREAWNQLQDARAGNGGCAGEMAGKCEQWRLEIDRLGENCPADQQGLLANAILAYDDRQLGKAQQYLDNLLSLPAPSPEAAVLRARVAIEEGNLPFAIRLLREQIRMNGDHAGLREVYASALFLTADYARADEELKAAEQLGSPVWRVEYGRGLIAEGAKDWVEARRHFEAAAKARPGWALPMARVRAIDVAPGKN